MYDPKGNGKDKSVDAVVFTETEPPAHLQGIVHRYLELKTNVTLAEDYRFHALPDACAYIVFDQQDATITGVSKLRATSEEFNLGRSFHFVNIRFLPGVWRDEVEPIAYGQLNVAYAGNLPLVELNRDLSQQSFDDMQDVLSGLVDRLVADGLVARNPVTETIFANLDEIHTVADMADLNNMSPRQLQRKLKSTTGFSPHDLLKVLRLQMALNGGDIWSYADQSHFIHSFRKATGYTPGKYAKKYDV
ncbi:putative HTH-type transcriptional regulator, AraC family [Sulfitobacter noctilucicola]|uniref:AraC-like DNA-binding protein n=1 Tax=Sulfitobacter noctilucicola TaxID=1342301 RepID=A0A7W6MA11_9RHOB|nr:AraC family transcriptional regulator [Sulfitobacter noctilucicola]KIN63277.1 putative HTH-type transcriptional regulator, AraC family [Sulfitobacter noctilucicola]MBB4175204.1 AraC-like DNA-binding protein [Sulfitobacter noctilucicola]